jgi:hypothetical protein
VQELKDVIWKVGEQRRLREEKRQQQELELERQQLEKLQIGSADAAVVSVACGDDSVITREPPQTVEDVFTSPPQLSSAVID